MNTKSKRLLKGFAIGCLGLLIIFTGFAFFGLRLMDIEDRYGDLQTVYFDAQDGDIILNKTNSKIAIIESDWHRIYVKNKNELIGIEEWLGPNYHYKFNLAIYRPNKEIKNIESVKISELQSQAKLISNINNY